jgi:hypothetical protein
MKARVKFGPEDGNSEEVGLAARGFIETSAEIGLPSVPDPNQEPWP